MCIMLIVEEFTNMNIAELNTTTQPLEAVNLKVIKVLQDALCAEYIYTKKIHKYQKIIFIYNLFSFVVPIVVLASLYVTKGDTVLEPIFNQISTIISFILLILIGFMFLTSIQDKKENFIVSRRINRRSQKDAENNKYKSDSELVHFFKHINDIDDNDLDKLGELKKSEIQASYRYALEQLGYDAKCASCKKLPTEYKWSVFKETCNVCGIKKG